MANNSGGEAGEVGEVVGKGGAAVADDKRRHAIESVVFVGELGVRFILKLTNLNIGGRND